MRSSLLIVFLLGGVVAAKSETEDAHSLLTAALGKYANLSAYYVEGTRESTSTDEVQRRWEQERFTLAKASDTKYHYDIRIPDRWNVVIADGEFEGSSSRGETNTCNVQSRRRSPTRKLLMT